MTTTGTSSSSLSAFLEEAGCCRPKASEKSQSYSFQEYVESAASDTGAQASAGTFEQGSAKTFSLDTKLGTESEQISQNGTRALTNQLTKGDPIKAAKGAESDVTAAAAVEHPSISAVRNAMLAEGLDPDSVQMTYHEVDVWFPGGGWVNEMLLIETSDGKSLDFSARLTERSPEVTVCDVRHMIEGTGGWATLS